MNFELPDNRFFDRVLNGTSSAETRYDMCCNAPMDRVGNEYKCEICGLIIGGVDQNEDHAKATSSIIRLTTGSKMQTFNVSHSTADNREKQIKEDLAKKRTRYFEKHGVHLIPEHVLNAVAKRYVAIQEACANSSTYRGNFIHRGGVRDKIFAALINDECNACEYGRKPDMIAEFMDLNSNGFAGGDGILRNLAALNLTTLSDKCNARGFARRYLNKLELDKENYIKFVVDIVKLSTEMNIKMTSQLPSKVVGAIWLLICSEEIDITSKTLEIASDNTKANTFLAFYKQLIKYPSEFVDIYRDCDIAYPF